MSDMLEKLREWTAEAEKLEAANERFAQEVAEIEKAAAQADAYRQVVNAQASHNWGYYQHLHKDELDQYWAQTVDNIVYAHGREAFYGRKSTYQYSLRRRKRCAPTEEPTR